VETPFAEEYVNAFAVMGKKVTLIDTGNPGMESYKQLKKELSQYGLSITDIDLIILTHMHTDHSGGVSLIQNEVNVPVFVHEQAKFVIEGGLTEYNRIEGFFTSFMEQCGAEPFSHKYIHEYEEENWKNVHYLKDGDTVHAGGFPFEVVYVPGHSQSDIILWDPLTGNTLAGDHLIASISVNAFIEPPPPGCNGRPKPLLDYRQSFEKVRSLPLSTIYPGHGEIFKNHIELIDRRLNEQENRCKLICEALRKGEKNVFELCCEIYPRLKGKIVFLGLSQIQGHLDLLESRLAVEAVKRESRIFYKLSC
jgi:glyoxylase-like metal-dependent hydrolase (beta-lactamase superfamily II)